MIRMGSRYSKIQTMSKEAAEKLEKEGIDITVAAKAELIGTGGASVSASTNKNTEDIEKFKSIATEKQEVTFGSRPPKDGEASTWLQDTFDRPYPIYYQLKSIVNIFTSENFNQYPDIPYKKIGNKLQKYLKSYCREFSNRNSNLHVECEGPTKGCGGGSICSAHANCVDVDDDSSNDQPSEPYKCKCKKGYEGDGNYCQRSPKTIKTGQIAFEEHNQPMADPVFTNGWNTEFRVTAWAGMQYCPDGALANGFIMKVQDPIQGDNTAANAVCLICNKNEICSKEGIWGKWSDEYRCPAGSFLSGWKENYQKFEIKHGNDNTALNNVEYRCRDLDTWKLQDIALKGNVKLHKGSWSNFIECPDKEFICGIDTIVRDPVDYPILDNTALHTIKHQCCKEDYNERRKRRERMKQKKQNFQ